MKPGETLRSDQMIDSPGAKLGIAEANLNNAHRKLIHIEEMMKRGQSLEDVALWFERLEGEIADLKTGYESVAGDPYPKAQFREPAFVERPEEEDGMFRVRGW